MTDINESEKPLIPFDEYYAALKSCVEDPQVIRAVNEWNAANKKYYDNGGDILSDSRDESDECYEAFNNIGNRVRFHSVESGMWDRMEMHTKGAFHNYVIQLISLDWPKILPYGIQVGNKDEVRRALLELSQSSTHSQSQIDFGDAQ